MKQMERRLLRLESALDALHFDVYRYVQYLGTMAGVGVVIRNITPVLTCIAVGTTEGVSVAPFSDAEVERFTERIRQQRITPERLTASEFERVMMDILPPIQVLNPDVSLDDL